MTAWSFGCSSPRLKRDRARCFSDVEKDAEVALVTRQAQWRDCMADTNWPQILAALAGGGAAGSMITAVVSSYRARKQPVGQRIDILPIFRPSGDAVELEAAIAIT